MAGENGVGPSQRWSPAQIQALAPDAASLKAGGKLAAPAPWSGAGAHPGAGVVWGECKGSGAKPYQVSIQLGSGGDAEAGSGPATAPAFACTCPSRKFPCKHAIGLLLLWSAGQVADAPEPAPRVVEWLAGRAQRAEKTRERGAARDQAAVARAAGTDGAADGSAGAAAARRRADRRTARIDEGLDELERWLGDQIRAGVSGLKTAGYRPIDQLARRLVDAQAPGVAARIRELPTALSNDARGDYLDRFSRSGPASDSVASDSVAADPVAADRTAAPAADWPERVLAELALLHLLIRGWRHRAALPDPLAATVRRRVGLAVPTEDVIATGEHVADSWLVLGRVDRTMDKLTERRVWLRGRRTGRIAMLLAFAPPGQSLGLALPVGSVVDVELVYVPEAAPLRAVPVGQELITPAGPADLPTEGTLEAAAGSFAATLAADPWTTSVPVLLSGAVPILPRRAGTAPGAEPGSSAAAAAAVREDGWLIADGSGPNASSVPLLLAADEDRARYTLLAVCGGRPAPLFGEYRPGGLRPITVWGEDGAVSLG
jgi:SWIM zinc finger